MEIKLLDIKEIKPYEKNPRHNEEAVEYVKQSIKEFGFKVPLVISKDGTIITGHTRYKAAKELKLKQVPCIIAEDLTEEQIKAFRIIDNKSSEKATWNELLLQEEIKALEGLKFDLGTFELENIQIEDTIETQNFIDDLLEEEIQTTTRHDDSREEFSLAFIFPKDKEDIIKQLLKDKTKKYIVEMIIKAAEDYAEEGE